MAARDRVMDLARNRLPMPPMQSVPQGRMVELPGRGTTYVLDVPGPEGAPTVVLLHALGCTATLNYYAQLESLSQHYRVLAFDQRWHGRGIRSSRFTFEDCADDTAALLDVLEIPSAIVVGYSMGGALAQLAWLRHAERVDGLVLAATARNWRGKRHEKLFFPVVGAAMRPLSPYARVRVERIGSVLPQTCFEAADAAALGRAEWRSTSLWTTPAVLAALGRFNSAPWIGEVDVPTAVVVTTRDRTVPHPRQRRLAAAIDGAEVFEVAGGHSSIVMKADLFGAALQQALASVSSRAASPRSLSA